MKPPAPHGTKTERAEPPFDAEVPDAEVLVEYVRREGAEAFEVMFKAYYGDLVAFVQVQVEARETAEELVQELFFDLWRRGADWHPQGALRPYLYGAARKKCLKYFRHRSTRRRREGHAEPEQCPVRESPETVLHYKELERAAERAVEALPERRRLVYTLSRYQGLTYAEIAAVLGLSINTVENQMVRAIKFLRERLAPHLS